MKNNKLDCFQKKKEEENERNPQYGVDGVKEPRKELVLNKAFPFFLIYLRK